MATRHCDAETLRALAHGALASSEAAQARLHLDSCEDCSLKLADLDPLAGETLAPGPLRPATTGEVFLQSPSRALQSGSRVDRYVILDRLGSGGMGEIYAAYDPELDRKVALKLMRMDVLSAMGTNSGRAKLLGEAKALARLNHPNVVAVHDVGTVGDEIFIAMELVEGEVLRDWLEATPRSTAHVLEVFRMAGRGLAAAHEVGLVHRDFKPLNVVVGRDGRARVVDFGLARTATSQADTVPGRMARVPAPSLQPIRPDDETPTVAPAETSAMVFSGTPAYMSPEQLRGQPTDARTDQFSFAVSLFEALCGHRPFLSDNVDDLLDAMEKGPAPTRAMPAWIFTVLARALSADREARYPSMVALLEALEKDPSQRRRQRWGMAGVALAAAVVVLGAAVARTSAQRRCSPPEARWAGLWDDARKASLRQAFAGTGKPFARAASDAVDRALDRYRVDWLAMHQQACLATLDGAQPREVLDLRTECLDRRLGGARALLDQLSRADEATVKNAARAVADLQPLQDCADEQALRAGAAWPLDPARRGEVEAVRTQVAELRAHFEVGHVKDAVELGAKAAAAARATGYKPLEAEAELLVAQVHSQRYEYAEAVAAEHRAAVAAQATGQLELMEQAWTMLVRHAAIMGSPESHIWAEYAEALLGRLSGDTRGLRAALLKAEGAAEVQRRQYPRALELARQSLELAEQAYGDDHLLVHEALGTMASAAWYLGDLDTALSTNERAAEIARRVQGVDHPAYADHLRDEAGILLERGDYEEALRRALVARGIYERTMTMDSPGPVTNEYYQVQAMAYLEAEKGASPAAEALARASLSRQERANLDPAYILSARVLVATVLHIRGNCADALPVYQQSDAINAPQASSAAGQWDVAEIRERLGACLLATGAPARARTVLEQSVRWFAENGTRNFIRAEGQFLLAQAEWLTGAKDQARKDAVAARAMLLTVSPRGQRLAPEVDRWLQEHPR